MRRSSAAAVATFGLAGSWLSPAGGASAGDTGVAVRSAVSATPAIEVRGADGTDRAALADALFRFASAGLQLPDLTVVFSDDESDCAGHMGAFDQRGEPWARQRVQRVGLRDPSRARPRLGRGEPR